MDPTLKSRTISRLKRGFAELPPQLRAAAKYITDNPASFGLDPIRDTARKSGVSTYSLVRLAQEFGFESYEDLRAPFRHALVSASEFVEKPSWLAPMYEAGETGRVQAEASLNAMAIVQRTLERQSPALLERIADHLLGADKVFLTAVRASYAMAYYFDYVGHMALPNMLLIPRHVGSALDDLNQARPGDVLVAITVTPYSRETIEACEFAQSRGASLILITDSDIVSPELKPFATLVASSVSTHAFGCFAGMAALLDVLLALLMKRGGDETEARVAAYADTRARYNAYWVPQKKR
jgi:DNA-binding MurR/RpiR family transcriptional regulator